MGQDKIIPEGFEIYDPALDPANRFGQDITQVRMRQAKPPGADIMPDGYEIDSQPVPEGFELDRDGTTLEKLDAAREELMETGRVTGATWEQMNPVLAEIDNIAAEVSGIAQSRRTRDRYRRFKDPVTRPDNPFYRVDNPMGHGQITKIDPKAAYQWADAGVYQVADGIEMVLSLIDYYSFGIPGTIREIGQYGYKMLINEVGAIMADPKTVKAIRRQLVTENRARGPRVEDYGPEPMHDDPAISDQLKRNHDVLQVVDENARGMWYHGRRTYPESGQTFGQSRAKVGNTGEPAGLSLTADKGLLEKNFAKKNTPEEILKETSEYDDSVTRVVELQKKTGELQRKKDDLISERRLLESDREGKIIEKEYRDSYDLIEAERDVNFELKKFDDQIKEEYTDQDILTDAAVQESHRRPTEFARTLPRLGGPPTKTILPAWKAPETEWAQNVLKETYEEAAHRVVRGTGGYGATDWSVGNWLDSPVGDTVRTTRESALRVLLDEHAEKFNQEISDILLGKGYKGLLYSPNRYNEWEMRMLNPDDVIMMDKRSVDDPGINRMGKHGVPLKDSDTSEKLMALSDVPGSTPEMNKILREEKLKGGSQARRMETWRDTVDTAPYSLRDIYEDIDLNQTVQRGMNLEAGEIGERYGAKFTGESDGLYYFDLPQAGNTTISMKGLDENYLSEQIDNTLEALANKDVIMPGPVTRLKINSSRPPNSVDLAKAREIIEESDAIRVKDGLKPLTENQKGNIIKAVMKANKNGAAQGTKLFSIGPGAMAGVDKDENGNMTFSPSAAVMGMMAMGAGLGVTKRLRSGRGKGKFMRGGGRVKGRGAGTTLVKQMNASKMPNTTPVRAWDQVESVQEAYDWGSEMMYLTPLVIRARKGLRYRPNGLGMYGNEKMANPNKTYPKGRNTWDIQGCGREPWATRNSIDVKGACYGAQCYAEVFLGKYGGSVTTGQRKIGLQDKNLRREMQRHAEKEGIESAQQMWPEYKLKFSTFPGKEGQISASYMSDELPSAKVSINLQPANGQDIRLGVDTDGSAWLADPMVMDAVLDADPRTLSVYSSAYHLPPEPHPLSARTMINVTISGWHPLPETFSRLRWAEMARDNGWNVILREVVANPAQFVDDAILYNRLHDGILDTDFFVMQQPLHKGPTHGKPWKGMPSCCQSKNPLHTCDNCEVAEGLGNKFAEFWGIKEEPGDLILPGRR